MHRHQPVGMRPRTLGRPDLASAFLQETLVFVRHSALYALFLCKDHMLVSALEIARADEANGDLRVSEREMRIRRREVVKVAMQSFAAGLMLVMHEVGLIRPGSMTFAGQVHSALVEPLSMIDVQFTDHYWIAGNDVRSWFAKDIDDHLPVF